MLLQGRDQVGQHRLEALATDPIRSLPADDEGFADRLIISPPGNGGCGRRCEVGSSGQPNRVLAMTAGHGDELVQDFGLLRLGGLLVALAQGFEEFGSCRLADCVVHRVPPEVGNIPLRQR